MKTGNNALNAPSAPHIAAVMGLFEASLAEMPERTREIFTACLDRLSEFSDFAAGRYDVLPWIEGKSSIEIHAAAVAFCEAAGIFTPSSSPVVSLGQAEFRRDFFPSDLLPGAIA